MLASAPKTIQMMKFVICASEIKAEGFSMFNPGTAIG
jgi:hypothetical protein